MRIRVTSDVEHFTRGMDEAARNQIPFALARALTRTAQDGLTAVGPISLGGLRSGPAGCLVAFALRRRPRQT